MLCWNCNGWSAGKIDELVDYIDTLPALPHVVALIETKRPLSGEVIPGYSTCAEWQSPCMGGNAGGIALACRTSCSVLTLEVTRNYVAAAVKVLGVGMGVLAAVYIPPVNSRHFTHYATVLNSLAESLGVLQMRHEIPRENVLFGGDWNAHLGRMDCGRPRILPEVGWSAVP